MRPFEFDLSLVPPARFEASAFLDAVEAPLFEAFEGDVTPCVSNGVPMLACTVEAETVGAALDAVAQVAASLGFVASGVSFPQHA